MGATGQRHRLVDEVLPLAGLALPYPDGAFAECRVLPHPPPGLPLRDIVLREAERVAAGALVQAAS